MRGIFQNAKSFNSDISKWDVSKVTDMRGMFYDAHSFNSDISQWDVSKVIDMGSMFWNADSFNIDISKWDVLRVTDMKWMFAFTSSFNSEMSKWDVSKVADMSSMFRYANSFNSDISKWNVWKVTNMAAMFYRAISFNHKLCGEAWVNSKAANTDKNFMFEDSFGSISTTMCGLWAIANILFYLLFLLSRSIIMMSNLHLSFSSAVAVIMLPPIRLTSSPLFYSRKYTCTHSPLDGESEADELES